MIKNKNKISEVRNQIGINNEYENQGVELLINTDEKEIKTKTIVNQSPKSDKLKTKQKETGKINQHNKVKIGLIILTVLIFLLLTCAIISENPIFIKTMIAITLIYVVSIIILICYRDHISKNEARKRIVLDENMQVYGYDRGINRSLNYEVEVLLQAYL